MKNRNAFLGVIVIAILVLGTIYSLFIRPTYYKYSGGEVYLSPVNNYRLSEEFVDMVVINGYIYECNKNGIIKKNIEGESLWSKGFFIEYPLMTSKGSYLAVADISGKSVFVFNEKGFIREIKESYPIINIHINKEGFLTVVQEKDKQNLIHYYSDEGVMVVARATRFFEDGYPIDVVASPDVTKMITGYLNVSNNRLQTKISFFGFDEQYDSYEENIIGGFTYDDALLSDIYWLDNNKSLVVMDNQIVIYNCEAKPSIIASIEVFSEIVDVRVTDEEIIVWYGKAIEENTSNHKNSVVAYDHNGKELVANIYEERIHGIAEADDGYFVLTSSKIVKYKGSRRVWFASTYLTIDEFYELEDDKFIARTDQTYEVLKMRKQ